MSAQVSQWNAAALDDLRDHWGGYGGYEIDITDAGWTAIPAGDPDGALTSDSPRDLREQIRVDHFRRHGPRAAAASA